jgi:Cu(I)/Ag(I) efflux system periplasmic protein CusF
MKRYVFALCTALLAVPAHAQMKGMDVKDVDMKMDKKGAAPAVHKASGVVTKVDAAGGKVTIEHGPVETMKWPAMSMTFAVKDKAMLGKLKKDQKVDFEFVQRGKDYVVTSVK